MSERNTLVPQMTGVLLANRLIWLAVSAAALAFAARGFDFSIRSARSSRRAAKNLAVSDEPVVLDVASLRTTPRFDRMLVVKQWWSQVRIDVRGVLRSYPFYFIVAFGIFNVLAGFFGAITQYYGTPMHPVTPVMLRVVDGNYVFVVFIIIVYYCGEVVHRERQSRVAEYVDAAPFPNSVMIAAKVAALWLIVVILMFAVMLTSMAVQAGHGFFQFEIMRYVVGLFVVHGWPMYLFCVLGVCIQSMAPNKFVGMLVLVGLFLGLQTMNNLGWEHVLYQMGVPSGLVSDMNGWGHYVQPMVTVGAYWSLWMLLVGIVAHLFALRGAGNGWRNRLVVARVRFTPTVRLVAGVTVVVAAALGGWIFYNTNVLNHYETGDDREALQADTKSSTNSTRSCRCRKCRPRHRDRHLSGGAPRRKPRTAELLNIHAEPIREIDLHVSRLLTINALEIPDSTPVEADSKRGFHRFALAPPLAPGAKLTLRWDLSWRNPGFVNSGSATAWSKTARSSTTAT